MRYVIDGNKILINDTSEFCPKHILECGQVFRYLNSSSGYKIFSKNLFCSLIYVDGYATIETVDTDYFVKYFDLNRDYGEIKRRLLGFPCMQEAIGYGYGVRILNQDPTEMIISFIISANNNIPRIQGIIERMCRTSGEPIGGEGFAFPTLDDLRKRDREYFASIGAGYRADYLVKSVDALANGFACDIGSLDTARARKKLMELTGVGRKVADCILLFGYHREDVFPVDTWIEKVYARLFGESNAAPARKADELAEYFGDLSGYAQQYLFYHARETYKNKTILSEERK